MNEPSRKVIDETIDEIKEIIRKKSNEQFDNKHIAWNSLYSALLMLNIEPDRELRS